MRGLLLVLFAIFFFCQISFAEDMNKENDAPIKNLYTALQEQGLSGSVRTDYFSSNRRLDDEADFLGAALQFKMLPRLNDWIDGRIDARFYNFDLRSSGEYKTELLEGLLTFRSENSNLNLGKQIITWGRADGINPTDNLSPKDYTVLLPEDSDRKLGVTSAKYDYFVSPELTATFFTTPFFEPNKVYFSFPSFIQAAEKKPLHTLENSEFALRLNKIGSGLDWSVSYFNGFDLNQEVKYSGMNNGNVLVEILNHRIQVFGADFAKNYGRYGIRGEAAYTMTEDMSGVYPDIKNPYLFYIIGGDRTFIDTLNINLQFIGRYIFNYSDVENIRNPAERAVYTKNAIFNNELDRIQYSMSGRIDYKLFNETLDMEIFVVYNFNRNDYFIRPLVRYSFTDSLKGTVGADIFQGDEDRTFYGSVKKNNMAYAELKYSF